MAGQSVESYQEPVPRSVRTVVEWEVVEAQAVVLGAGMSTRASARCNSRCARSVLCSVSILLGEEGQAQEFVQNKSTQSLCQSSSTMDVQ